MRVAVLCTDPEHPVNAWLARWGDTLSAHHEVHVARRSSELSGGDILFLVSCHEIVRKPTRDRFRYTLVLHASALPAGRGMSPQVWQILEGKNEITVSMLNAEDQLDTGDIWQQQIVSFEGHELCDEINASVFEAEVTLMSWAIDHVDQCVPWSQQGEGSYYCKRSSADSRIDPEQSLASQFNLLRVADPVRYPAFFELRGRKYKIVITKI